MKMERTEPEKCVTALSNEKATEKGSCTSFGFST
jgi:hypothetical protein